MADIANTTDTAWQSLHPLLTLLTLLTLVFVVEHDDTDFILMNSCFKLFQTYLISCHFWSFPKNSTPGEAGPRACRETHVSTSLVAPGSTEGLRRRPTRWNRTVETWGTWSSKKRNVTWTSIKVKTWPWTSWTSWTSWASWTYSDRTALPHFTLCSIEFNPISTVIYTVIQSSDHYPSLQRCLTIAFELKACPTNEAGGDSVTTAVELLNWLNRLNRLHLLRGSVMLHRFHRLHRLHRLGVTVRTKQLDRAEPRVRFWRCPFCLFTFCPFCCLLTAISILEHWELTENIPKRRTKPYHSGVTALYGPVVSLRWHYDGPMLVLKADWHWLRLSSLA